MKAINKRILIHLSAIVLFAVISAIFFAPVFEGKALNQGDMTKAASMSHEQDLYKQQTGNYTNWTSSMFSGMPSYQTYCAPQTSIFTPLKYVCISRGLGTAKERSFGVLFLYFIGFYIALTALGVNPYLSIVGALAFGLGSYNVIIIEAGHITKAWAISMIAPVFAGIILTLKDKRVWGFILFTLSLGLQIQFNHIQITYYTLIGAIILGIALLVDSILKKKFSNYLKGLGVIVIGCIFAVACNARHLFVNNEYSKYTMRGGSELTIKPHDLYKDAATETSAEKVSSGLDLNYAFNWSYGKGETFTILIPGMYGGGSGEKMKENSQFYQQFKSDTAPLYWGDQPFTSGPVYFGSVVIFLFVLGLIIVKGAEKWWLLITSIITIFMSWGKNWMGFNEFLFHNLPLYNMFRTPSMSLVLTNVCMILLGVLALKVIFENRENKKFIEKSIYWSAGITAGLCLIFILFSSSFSYTGSSDIEMSRQYGNYWPDIFNALSSDRKALLVSDCWRSIIFILLSAAIIWLYYVKKSMKKTIWGISAIAILLTLDLWTVDRRYIDESNYVNERSLSNISPAGYDFEIDRYAAQFGDKDYRVFNYAVNTFNDSYPSSFHHQIGGYHAAKLRRYQDIIDFYISQHVNIGVLNMLNAKYFVAPDRDRAYIVQRNPEALGNAWFVDSCIMVKNPNEEILAIDKNNHADNAIVNEREFGKMLSGKDLKRDSNSKIEMLHQQPYNPDKTVYKTNTSKEQLAVFSEIYYKPDWFAYIDGKPADYLRVNYILRAIIVPEGEHTIEFRNEAPLFHKLDKINLASSFVLVICMASTLLIYYRKRKKNIG